MCLLQYCEKASKEDPTYVVDYLTCTINVLKVLRDVYMMAYLSKLFQQWQERRNACVCQFYRKVTARVHNKRTLGNSKKEIGRCT